MGYYQIVTSELEMGDREVIEKYHGLTQIEDQFREMKGTLKARPVFVQTPEHIKAHLMVCFMALTMIRIIQRKTRLSAKPAKGATCAKPASPLAKDAFCQIKVANLGNSLNFSV